MLVCLWAAGRLLLRTGSGGNGMYACCKPSEVFPAENLSRDACPSGRGSASQRGWLLEAGCCDEGPTSRRGSRGRRSEGRSDIQRVDRHPRRIGQRRHQSQGLRATSEAGLHRGFLRAKGPTAVSKSIRGLSRRRSIRRRADWRKRRASWTGARRSSRRPKRRLPWRRPIRANATRRRALYAARASSRRSPSRISTTRRRTIWRRKRRFRLPEPQVETARAQIPPRPRRSGGQGRRRNRPDQSRLHPAYSPIDGIAGIAQQQVGALVSPASGPVTTVSTVDPIKVYFTVSEQEYLDFHRRFPTRKPAWMPTATTALWS